MKKNNPDLSICIVSWNTCDKLRECISSIMINTDSLIIEIIVVDNASSDNTVKMIKAEFPKAILIENRQNIGFGRANNIAIKRAEGNYILLLNPDIVIIQPCLKKMISFLKTYPQVGVVGCKLINIDGSIQKSYFESFPTPLSELYWGMMLHKAYNSPTRNKKKKSHEVHLAWIAGACMLFKRDVLIALKGFDEKYFMYGEDLDLCYRMWKMGLKAYYISEIQMLHYHGASSKKQSNRHYSAIMQRESVYKFMLTHYGRFSALLYRIIWILSGLVRVVILTTGYIFSLLLFNRKRRYISNALEKYSRVVSWGLGFEKWCRKETHI